MEPLIDVVLSFVCAFRKVRAPRQPAVPQTSPHNGSAHAGKSTPGHSSTSIRVGSLDVCVCVCLFVPVMPVLFFALQSAMLGNGLVLQNLLHMQLAQQQLLHIKDKRISSVRYLRVCLCARDDLHRLVARVKHSCGHVLLHFHLQHLKHNEAKPP